MRKGFIEGVTFVVGCSLLFLATLGGIRLEIALNQKLHEEKGGHSGENW